MFGIDGIEFFIILIVMIVVVGPKDLPKMVRAFGQATAKMRKTAMEFRRHFDEAMREAELGDLSDTLHEMKKLDPRKNLTEIFDPIRNVTSDIKASLTEPVVLPSAPSVPPLDTTVTEAAIERKDNPKKDSPRKDRPTAIKKAVTKQKTQAVERTTQTKKNAAKKAVKAS